MKVGGRSGDIEGVLTGTGTEVPPPGTAMKPPGTNPWLAAGQAGMPGAPPKGEEHRNASETSMKGRETPGSTPAAAAAAM